MSASKRYLFIVNPIAGDGKKRKILTAISAFCNQHPNSTVLIWQEIEQIDELVQIGISGGFEAIIAVGGDGTVHEIGKRLIHKPIALGVVPAGSGNGLARHLHLPQNPISVIRSIEDYIPISMDTAQMNGKPYLNVFGFGVDAQVAHQFAHTNRRGFIQYGLLSIKGFLSMNLEPCVISTETEKFHLNSFQVAVANIREYGNGALIAPTASVLDGNLEVVMMKGTYKWNLPSIIMRLFNGSLPKAPYYQSVQSKKVTIERIYTQAQIDGEPIEISSPIVIEVIPKSLQILVPRTKKLMI
ncbi:MAG: hypothetical protein NZ108_03605 [Bacteroidia bacterium]|nr:hypothetical protein [Bacteroidia bacterium]